MRPHTGSGPQVGRRTSDVRERLEWERQQAAKTPQQVVADFYAEAYKAQQEREKKWAADEERRRQAIAARYDEIEQHNKEVIAQRTHAKLLAGMFEQHGASDVEQNKVKRLVEQRRYASCGVGTF